MPSQYEQIKSGHLDVGKLYADTKQIYLDARANAAEFNEPRLRTDAMYTIVEMIGRLLRQIQTWRIYVTKGEVGLKGFDADLAGLQKRYTHLYKPFFEGLPHPAEWEAEHWTSFEEDLEGPILLWDLKACQERWGIAFGSPPCEGPDLHMALSLLHQLGVAEEVQAELVASLYGLADVTMKEIGSYWSEKGQKAAEATAQAFKDIANKVKDYFPNPNTPKHIAWGLGVALAVGGGGYVWLKTRK
jgi:hypothetical protein